MASKLGGVSILQILPASLSHQNKSKIPIVVKSGPASLQLASTWVYIDVLNVCDLAPQKAPFREEEEQAGGAQCDTNLEELEF
ncbi:hypothetical protein RHMOL_Rhmol10G0219700 [Rhododendron molle]|uniref:Uncharacterized protein n=1 Tax=Rhododendron molle TaxID=49168 RepID=A0ACC0M5Z4_RHOML|nr:hypothetical protein RHMOL_Rhmol10G0219700 [Rhododendron molle]